MEDSVKDVSQDQKSHKAEFTKHMSAGSVSSLTRIKPLMAPRHHVNNSNLTNMRNTKSVLELADETPGKFYFDK